MCGATDTYESLCSTEGGSFGVRSLHCDSISGSRLSGLVTQRCEKPCTIASEGCWMAGVVNANEDGVGHRVSRRGSETEGKAEKKI